MWQVGDEEIYLVVNAGCREKDLAHIKKHLDKFTVSCLPSCHLNDNMFSEQSTDGQEDKPAWRNCTL